jgi:hypothetical protein
MYKRILSMLQTSREALHGGICCKLPSEFQNAVCAAAAPVVYVERVLAEQGDPAVCAQACDTDGLLRACLLLLDLALSVVLGLSLLVGLLLLLVLLALGGALLLLAFLLLLALPLLPLRLLRQRRAYTRCAPVPPTPGKRE